MKGFTEGSNKKDDLLESGAVSGPSVGPIWRWDRPWGLYEGGTIRGAFMKVTSSVGLSGRWDHPWGSYEGGTEDDVSESGAVSGPWMWDLPWSLHDSGTVRGAYMTVGPSVEPTWQWGRPWACVRVGRAVGVFSKQLTELCLGRFLVSDRCWGDRKYQDRGFVGSRRQVLLQVRPNVGGATQVSLAKGLVFSLLRESVRVSLKDVRWKPWVLAAAQE